MNKALACLLAVVGSVAVSCSTTQGTRPPAADFTIVALPDTQFYSRNFPKIFQAQTDWIIANRTRLNVVYVAQLGDLVNDGDKFPAQWLAATNALYRLESPALTGLPEGIPYGVVPGNHDHVGGTKGYNASFGPEHFAGRKYYGGHFGTNNQNHYDRFSTGGFTPRTVMPSTSSISTDEPNTSPSCGRTVMRNSSVRAVRTTSASVRSSTAGDAMIRRWTP